MARSRQILPLFSRDQYRIAWHEVCQRKGALLHSALLLLQQDRHTYTLGKHVWLNLCASYDPRKRYAFFWISQQGRTNGCHEWCALPAYLFPKWRRCISKITKLRSFTSNNSIWPCGLGTDENANSGVDRIFVSKSAERSWSYLLTVQVDTCLCVETKQIFHTLNKII